MVLQHDEPTIWGTSDPGATVQTLIFRDGDKAAGKVYQTAVRADGFWKVDLDPVAPSSGLVSYAIEVSTAGSAAILLEDVLFGVVFGCFGQSNMVMSASQTEESYTEAQLSNGLLRVFQAGNTIWYGNPNSSVPRSLIPTDTIYTSPGAPGWAVASRESIMGKEWTAFSATCFAFGTTLDEAFRRHVPDKRVPIGLMSIAVSGTSIQAWSSAQALKGCPQPVAPTYEEVPDVFDASILYNGLVQPLALGPLPFEGLAFYQGETNAEAGFAHAGDYYKCQLTATLSDMLTRFTKPRTRRTPWMGYVQITPFVAINAFAEPVLRNSQQNAIDELQRRFPQIGVSMVTAIDLGDADSRWSSIHPRYKRPIGQRLAWSYLSRSNSSVLPSRLDYPRAYPAFGTSCALMSSPGSIVVSFLTSSLPRNATILYSSGACPSRIERKYCGGLEISNGSDWASPSSVRTIPDDVLPGGAVLLQSSLAGRIKSRYAFAPWPVVELRSVESLPVLPWNESEAGTCSQTTEDVVRVWLRGDRTPNAAGRGSSVRMYALLSAILIVYLN